MKRYWLTVCLITTAILIAGEFHKSPFPRVSNAVEAQSLNGPELPRVYLNTAYVPPSGSTIRVSAGGNLQSAINAASPGDVIVLEAGATYTSPSDGLVLPYKSGSGWITIQTSNLAGIPLEGTRVNPSVHSSAMPKILTRDAGPAIIAATRAGEGAPHHYRFVGIEIALAPAVTLNHGLVRFGESDSRQSTMAAVPHDLILDRCYIHGRADATLVRGVALNSARSAVIDSYISECHGIGFDTQAIAGWNGPGPFKIVNNYLEGAGENVMFGGADPKIQDLVPSDIEFRRNHCFKPLSWKEGEPSYGGRRWSVKNIFELKNARRVLVDGNVFENNWVDGQNGTAILFTVRNQEGTAPWSAVEDVTFTNNILRHTAAGFLILGHDYNGASQQAGRILIRNNVIDDVGGSRWGANGRLYDIESGTTDAGPANIQIDHNTAFHTGNVIVAGEYDSATSSYPLKPGFIYTNNITRHNDYGVIGSNSGTGLTTLNNYFPGHFFQRNILVGGPSSLYPASNYFPASIEAVGFADFAGGNYRLSLNSPYRNAGTDGRDIGADMDAIIAAMGSEPAPPPNQPPQVTLTATPIQGVAPLPVQLNVSASDSDGQVMSYRLECGDGHISSAPTCSHTFERAGAYTARVLVTDDGGATATASLSITVSEPVNPSPASNVVLYAAQAPVKSGGWRVVTDQAAAGGSRLHHPDASGPKLSAPLASPVNYFEMTFQAEAGRAYRLWIRGKAQNDYWGNDSVFAQFSDSVTSSGAAAYRIGTTSGTELNLEDCSGCGLSGWGWQDNGWGVGVMGPAIYFQSTGVHRIRVQTREDGLSIDQIVLSAGTYLSSAPGAVRNDSTILPISGGGSPPVVTPSITTVLPNTSLTLGGVAIVITGTNFAAGATVTIGGTPASNVVVIGSTLVTAVVPPHAAGRVDVVVTNPDRQSATLAGGFTYVSLRPPTVSITASTLSGVLPLPVNFTSTASAPDGFIASYRWDFGNGQTSTAVSPGVVYRTEGSFTARLTVTDNSGATASASVTINVSAGTAPSVRVLTPNTRVTLRANSVYNITWSVAAASNIMRQEIYLSLDNGASWRVVTQELAPMVTNYAWRVPKTATQNARIKVIVRCYNGMSGEDMSDTSFIIAK